MKAILSVAVTACVGCSALLMDKPKPSSSYAAEPACTTKQRFAISDVVLVVVDVFAFAYAITLDTNEGDLAERQMVLLTGAVVDGLARTFSARAGFRWLKQCHAAKRAYADHVADEQRLRAEAAVQPPPRPPTPPQGFYCATHFCSRDQPLCEQTKTDNDAAQCTRTETAYCFALSTGGQSCWKTADECELRHGVTDERAGECAEAR